MKSVQVGSVTYNKAEESVLSRAFILGMLLGVPLGIIINFIIGFPTIPKLMLANTIDRSVAFSISVAKILGFWWALTTIFSFFFYYKKKQLTLSWSNAGRIFFFTLLVPCSILFVVLVFSIFFVPLYLFLYPYFSPVLISSIGFLLFFPFVFLFVAAVLPDSKPRKILNRIFHRPKTKSAK